MDSRQVQPLRGALIGCGFFARNHMHAWQQVDGALISAVCDRDPDRAQEFADSFSVGAVYTDPVRMLQEEQLDFVDIATTPETHRELVELAARHGVHAICQKPMAPGVSDGRAMVEACRSAGTQLMIHENFRWQPAIREAWRVSRHLGDLHYARISFMSGYDVYRDQPYLATDERFILYDVGVHMFDLVRFFLGEATQLSCHSRSVNPRVRGEDFAVAQVLMASGASCTVELSYAAHPAKEPFPQTLLYVEGANGSVSLEQDFQVTQVLGGASTIQVPTPRFEWSAPPAEAVHASMPPLQQHWVDCLRNGTSPETSGEDNLRTLEMVFAAYESAGMRGQPVLLGERQH